MSGSITVNLSDNECEVLANLSEVLDIPQERILIHALRYMQKNFALCEETNAVLRSAYQIVSRKGDRTDWDNFEPILKDVLQRQHEIMYPKQYAEPVPSECRCMFEDSETGGE